KDEDGSLTPEERAESQAKIDAAIDAIGGLAAGTINGRRVLDGSAAFRTSGVDSSQVANLTVYRTSATSGATAAQTIFGRVLEAATKAELVYAGKEGSATIQADATFVLTGSLGSAEFSVSEDDPLTELRDEINRASHKTGLVATLSGDNLSISSVGYGAAATIAVEVSDGTFTTTGGHGDGTASGTDATVEINGQTYGPETRTGYTAGNTFTYNENGFHYSLELRAGYQGTLNTMTVGDGALRYAISPDVGRTSALSIPSLLPARLGGISGTLDQLRTGGSLGGLGDNTSQAIRALDEALGQLTLVRGSVDGFYNSQVASASALLADLETDLEDAIDEIDGVNVAEEDTLIAYYQDLAANAVSGMAILSQQRASIVQMLRHIAGLA
ncbi:MAG: flagellin hook IN motif-containing protein, partial [Thermoguttaceae bacterium]|nr:flagellin hook IN motif-containing protein [Thermoguttaceae bacterium]